jgi:hypothetical protein
MQIYNNEIYQNYGLNLVDYKTKASLSMAIFTSNFYKEQNNIRVISGFSDMVIRKSYKGGIVECFDNYIENGFLYDMNSQYPFAMLNDMPVGNPVFVNCTDISNFFGFAYGLITPPSKERLKNAILGISDVKGNTVRSRAPFESIIFSEEIKYAITQGYTFQMQWGFSFKRGKNIFDDFVNHFYNIKRDSKDSVQRANAKLCLNSLYGKFGQRDTESRMLIVSEKDIEAISKKNHIDFSVKLGEDSGLCLVKYKDRINETLRRLYKKDVTEQLLEEDPDQKLEPDLDRGIRIEDEKRILLSNYFSKDSLYNKKHGVPSSSPIAAATRAYGRIAICKFLNIPGNEAIYADTDSAVLPKELDSKFVGKELGQMKLVHTIKKGIFIRKKFYLLETKDDIIIASSGTNNNLSYSDFLNLMKGNSITKINESFSLD